eukprot:5533662-Prymnesium_polylepis.1
MRCQLEFNATPGGGAAGLRHTRVAASVLSRRWVSACGRGGVLEAVYGASLLLVAQAGLVVDHAVGE